MDHGDFDGASSSMKYIITDQQIEEIHNKGLTSEIVAALKPIEPITGEQVKQWKSKYPAEDLCHWSYNMGAADAERHILGETP